MSTFLELVQDFTGELEIPGFGAAVSTVVGQTNEALRLVNYVRDADLDIQHRWHDWGWLWSGSRGYTGSTTLNSTELSVSKPSDVNVYDWDSFWIDKDTDDAIHLEYAEYKRFRDDFTIGTQTSDPPAYIVMRPDKTLRVWPQSDSGTYSVTGEYWRVPTILAADADVSAIPEDFHRAIILRAKIMYAEGEDAPEILAGSVGEFAGLIQMLESSCLPDGGRRQSRMSEARTGDMLRVMAV